MFKNSSGTPIENHWVKGFCLQPIELADSFTQSQAPSLSDQKESRMYFLLQKGMRNEAAFLLKEVRIILSKLEFLVMKDKLNIYKKLKRERILPLAKNYIIRKDF